MTPTDRKKAHDLLDAMISHGATSITIQGHMQRPITATERALFQGLIPEAEIRQSSSGRNWLLDTPFSLTAPFAATLWYPYSIHPDPAPVPQVRPAKAAAAGAADAGIEGDLR